MKLLLLNFAHILSASLVSFSPILFHFLCSNGYMSPSIDIKSLLSSPSTHNKELVQIVAEAQRSTRLVRTTDDSDTLAHEYEPYDFNANTCFRNVLAIANALQYHRMVFQRGYNGSESKVDSYYLLLYWAKKDCNFLLSIKPQTDKALNGVVQTLLGKVSILAEEYHKLFPDIPSHSTLIMTAYRMYKLPAPPLPPFDLKWAKVNDSVEPKVHYSLLSELLRRKIISTKFFTSCKDNYSKNYASLIKSKGDDCQLNSLDVHSTPAVILNHKELYYSITTGWIAFKILRVQIQRAMPSSESGLIENFNMELKAMEEIVKENDTAPKYALKCSCLHMDYLIGCMRFALLFDLLSYQDHTSCVDLIYTHREVAFGMIGNLTRRAQ